MTGFLFLFFGVDLSSELLWGDACRLVLAAQEPDRDQLLVAAAVRPRLEHLEDAGVREDGGGLVRPGAGPGRLADRASARRVPADQLARLVRAGRVDQRQVEDARVVRPQPVAVRDHLVDDLV